MDISFFFQAEDGIRDHAQSRGLGDVYKRQIYQAAFSLYILLSSPIIIFPLKFCVPHYLPLTFDLFSSQLAFRILYLFLFYLCFFFVCSLQISRFIVFNLVLSIFFFSRLSFCVTLIICISNFVFSIFFCFPFSLSYLICLFSFSIRFNYSHIFFFFFFFLF
eukprot:TRINITY_DN17893_c0_g1_i1.p1 TRINITY_DN17893_c0_g1~~TRINITY_DN17893_c0_g1_i1.p1  ORF type:complete len:162 (+),score=8.35 TRINITY_DN17893_c0_g1_i1:80-565(+)